MDDTTIIAEAEGAVSAYLEVLGSTAVKPMMYPLHEELVIGRDPQDSLACDRFLCVPEPTVSRRHARIRRRGEAFFVEDLHSFNGTFVLGNRLRPGEWYPLRDGDELAVASTQLVFHSLMLPPRESMPSIITKAVDASRLTLRTAPSDASRPRPPPATGAAPPHSR